MIHENKLPERGFNSATPKVSVLILTYNHERFITQAIESVLMQAADFEFEVVIGNDCSTDGTATLLRCFREKYSGKIRVQQPKRNLGMHANFARTFALCRGEYVALLEGDDYWTSPDKLQTQVSHLEKHRDCAFCFHQVNLTRGSENDSTDLFPKDIPATLTLKDLLQANPIPTCSVVFRRELLQTLPDWCMKLKILDWPLYLLLAERGNAGFLKQPLAAYRIHQSGLWTTTPHKTRSEVMIEVLREMNRHLRGRYSGIIRRRIAEAYFHISWCNEEQGLLSPAFKANCRAIAADPMGSNEYKINWLRLLARTLFAGVIAARYRPKDYAITQANVILK